MVIVDQQIKGNLKKNKFEPLNISPEGISMINLGENLKIDFQNQISRPKTRKSGDCEIPDGK
jgi:hypothetical protein